MNGDRVWMKCQKVGRYEIGCSTPQNRTMKTNVTGMRRGAICGVGARMARRRPKVESQRLKSAYGFDY